MSADLFSHLIDYSDALGRVTLCQTQWKTDPDTLDYVCVDTQRMVMEKARFVSRELHISGTKVRFWLKEHGTVVEKYFAPNLEPVGWFMPICTGFEASQLPLCTDTSFLGMCVSQKRQIVVTGEKSMQQALVSQLLTRQEADSIQAQLRQLRLDCVVRRYPPAIVRNFELVA